MYKKFIIFTVIAAIVTTSGVFAAKYTVNKSGTVKTQSGNVVAPASNTVNQSYYNNYYAQDYVSKNQVNSSSVGTIEIVMDFSGSMSNWINVAKKSITSILAQIPADTKIGFRVFGHDNYGNNPTSIHTLQDVKKIVKNGNKFTVITEKGALGRTSGACSATRQVAMIQSSNADSILNGMNSVDIGGATPLVYALDRAIYQDFATMDTTTPKKIILITDGGENCGGDPCAFARSLMKKRSDVHIDVVLASAYSRTLTCLATTTGGHFYTMNNLSDFTDTITKSIQKEPATAAEIKKQNYEFIDD